MPSIIGILMSTSRKTLLSIGGVLLVVVLFVGLFLWPEGSMIEQPKETLRSVELVAAGSLVEDRVLVSSLGTVQSLQDVSVRAETSGQIVKVNINEGDQVQSGQVLLELERQSLDAQVLQAQARLSSAQATLNKLLNGDRVEDVQILEQKLLAEKERLKELERGSRPEELAITETALENAQKNLEDAQQDLENALQKADIDMETQLKRSIDLMQSVAGTMEKVLTQNLQDIIYPIRFPDNRTCTMQINATENYNLDTACFANLKASEDQKELFNQYQSQEEITAEQVLADLELTRTRLQNLRDFFVDALEVTSKGLTFSPFDDPRRVRTITDDELTSLKSKVTSGQAEVEAAIAQMTTQMQTLETQIIANQSTIDAAEARVNQSENVVKSSETELTLRKIGATEEQLAIQRSQIQQLELQLKVSRDGARPEDIQAQRAAVQQAQADVAVSIANRDKAIIRAPISGTILQFSHDIGDYLSNGAEVLLLANRDELEVITYVTEEERRFIENGSPVQMMDNTVKGTVRRISPALDQQTKKIEVTITLDEGLENVVIGQTIFAGFELVMDPLTVRVPLDAVKVVGTSAFVYTVDEDARISVIPVTVGKIFADTILIKGIRPNMMIIPDVANLEGGQEVSVQKTISEEGVEQVYYSVPNTFPEVLPQLSPEAADQA